MQARLRFTRQFRLNWDTAQVGGTPSGASAVDASPQGHRRQLQPPCQCAKISSSAKPARSSLARVARNPKAASANSRRPSRSSMASSLRLERVQVQHVGRRVVRAAAGKARSRPSPSSAAASIARRRASSPHKILEAVTVGVGAHQLGGDLGAVDRRRHDTEVLLHHGDVEAREVEDLETAGSRSRAFRFGASYLPPSNCTRWAVLSPAESCTRHSRSRLRLSPSVSVSIGDAGPEVDARPADRPCAA